MNLRMSAFQKCMVEILRRIVPVNPSGSWTNDRPVTGSSGLGPATNDGGGDIRYQLMMQIMGMSVGDPALQSLQYFLAEAVKETDNTGTPTPTTAQRPVGHSTYDRSVLMIQW